MRRMRIIMATCAIIMGAVPAAAQIHAGLLAGMNLGRLSFDPDAATKQSGRAGFAIGGVFDLGLGEQTALHVEPMYVQKGGTRTADDIDNKISMSYVEVPLMLRILFSDARTSPYIMAGPSFGFVMSAKVSATENGVTNERDMKSEVKALDFGLGFGAGVNMAMGRNVVFFEARYALGSSDINDFPGSNNPTVKTRGIQFFAGYLIPLGDPGR